MTGKSRRRFALRRHANDSGMDEAELQHGGANAPRPISSAVQGKLQDNAPTRRIRENKPKGDLKKTATNGKTPAAAGGDTLNTK